MVKEGNLVLNDFNFNSSKKVSIDSTVPLETDDNHLENQMIRKKEFQEVRTFDQNDVVVVFDESQSSLSKETSYKTIQKTQISI